MVRKRHRVVCAGAAPAFLGFVLCLTGAAPAQFINPRGSTPVPVYADDSTAARHALDRLSDLIAGGNEGEAVRSLQRLLDDSGDRVLEVEGDADLYISVREHVHRRLLANPELLERYRRAQEPEAARQLQAGRERLVEQTRLLTPSGYEAALRVAQLDIESARFDAARFMLMQLEPHPDRRGRGGADAARLMLLLSRYTDRADVRDAADRWSAEAGLEEKERSRISGPPGVEMVRLDPTTASPRIDLNEIVARPIQSVRIDPDSPAVGIDTMASGPWALPALVGDDLFISDGVRVVSLDRFTLSHRWATEIARASPRGTSTPDRFRRRTERPVQPRSVAVGDGLVFTTTGHGPAFEADRPDVVKALDRRTGEVVWSFHPMEAFDQFAGAESDGIVRHHEGTVVFAAQIRPDDRRLWSYRLFGLDASTGEVRWSRLIGTAGSVGWSAAPVRPTIQRVEDGVVYRSDSFGLISAIETATGRVRWVRRRTVEAYGMTPDLRPALAPSPEFVGGRLVVLSGDAGWILLLDPKTGELHHEIDAVRLSSPAMALAVGDWIALLGNQGVRFLHADDPDPTKVVDGPQVSLDGLSGRPLSDGERLLLPMSTGMGVVDPSDPRRLERIELDRGGVILAAEGQVLVSSAERLHSYLVWETAQRTLAARLQSNREDPEPALTLAELAYLAGRSGLIEGAVAELIERLAQENSEEAKEVRRRGFRAVLEMLEPTGRWAERAALELEVRAGLIGHLLHLASTPEERVSGLLVKGSLAESSGDAGGALEVYQGILADTELASSNWRGPGAVLRADMETTRRIRRVLRASGGGLYEPYEREAARRAEALGEDADAAALLELASRFPASSVSPGLWLRSSRLAERDHEAERALLASMDAMVERSAAGMRVDMEIAGEVTGRLARSLIDQRRPQAAARVLDRAARSFPDATLTAGGEPIDAEALRSRVTEVLSDLAWRPRIGREIGRPSATFEGASIAPPMLTSGAPVAPGYIVLRRKDSLTLVEPDEGEAARIRERWSRPAGPDSSVLRADREGVIVYETAEDEQRLVRLDAETGREVWSLSVDALLERTGETRVSLRLVGEVRPDDLVAASTDRTLVLARRAGDTVAIDIDTGRTLWRRARGETLVHTLIAGSGVVAIGTQDISLNASTGVAVVDERSGERVATLTESELVPGGMRWLRLTDSRVLIVGLEDRVAAFDLTRGERLWAHAGGSSAGSVDAWLTGGSVAVLTPDRGLSLIEAETGERVSRLETDAALISSGPTELVSIDGRDAFVSASGVLLLDERGAVAGRDAVSGSGAVDSFAMPGVAAELFVLVERRARVGSASRVRLADASGRFVSSPTALMLRDDDEAERMGVLEGVLLVETRLGVIVLPAPLGGLSG